MRRDDLFLGAVLQVRVSYGNRGWKKIFEVAQVGNFLGEGVAILIDSRGVE